MEYRKAATSIFIVGPPFCSGFDSRLHSNVMAGGVYSESDNLLKNRDGLQTHAYIYI